jgi:hypothetical protein
MVIKLRESEMDGTRTTRMGEMRNVYKILVGKSDGERPLGRPGRTREDNIRMDLRETGCEGAVTVKVVHFLN